MQKEFSKNKMGTEPIGKLMLTMGIPMILSMVLQAVLSQRLVVCGDALDVAREILVRTPAVSQLIRSGKEHQLPTVMQTGAALGMRTMDQALIRFAKGG